MTTQSTPQTPLEKHQASLALYNKIMGELDKIEADLLNLVEDVHEFNKKYRPAIDVVNQNKHLAKEFIKESEEKILNELDADNDELLHVIIGAKLDSLVDEAKAKIAAGEDDQK